MKRRAGGAALILRLTAAAGCAAAWTARAGAEEDLGAWLGSTPAAAAEPFSASGQAGNALLALLLVVGLMLLLYWGLRRVQRRVPAAADAPAERILLRARFNRLQTLVLLERGGELQCLILRGRQVEFMADVPAEGRRRSGNAPASPDKAGTSFQDVWRSLLNAPPQSKRPAGR